MVLDQIGAGDSAGADAHSHSAGIVFDLHDNCSEHVLAPASSVIVVIGIN
jgi:hypothetical protein